MVVVAKATKRRSKTVPNGQEKSKKQKTSHCRKTLLRECVIYLASNTHVPNGQLLQNTGPKCDEVAQKRNSAPEAEALPTSCWISW